MVTTLSIIAYLDYRIPRATTTIQVHPGMISLNFKDKSRGRIENELENILSTETLALAVNILEIKEVHQAEAISRIKENVITEPVPGTDFITITAKDPDPRKAKNIANAIAEAFVQKQTEEEADRVAKALETLDEELAAHKKIVDSKLEHLESLLPQSEDHSQEQTSKSYEQALALLHDMELKQHEARIILEMPRTPITIHERASLRHPN